MNGEGKSMDNYRGSVQTWNPPVTIKQEPEYDLYGETAQSHHNHRMQHAHQQHHPSSHHSRSEFVSLPYFQQQQQQYMMPAENGCHYHMTEVGRPGEEEEDSLSTPKKRGRKKKIKVEDQDLPLSLEASFPVIRKRGRPRKYPIPDGLDNVEDGRRPLKQEKITDSFKQRKRIDRFEGMPEEEVAKRTLPDHLVPNLDIVIIGINPGLFAAFKGHHYAGPGNHFWRCLFLAGLIPEPMTAVDDFKLIHYGIGFTNIVARTTRSSADLSRKEIKEGAEILLDKLKIFQPRIAVFNGKGIYEIFSGNKNFVFGRQPEPIEGTNVVEAKEEPCDDDDASDPFSTEGTDDGSSGYDGNNTFHVQMKEEPGDHSVSGSYQPDQAKRRGRKKKTETALQSDYSVARTAVGMQPPQSSVLTEQQHLHHHTGQLPNNQMASEQPMHSQQDMPQPQMDYHSNYYNAHCNQQPYYQQDGFPDQASSYSQWNSGAPLQQQLEYPCQQPAESSPPGSNWAYPSTYSEDLCRAADFPSWLKQEPLDSCDTGGSYC
ncbi:thymine DNA glycosylase isoform X2 [Rhipicephalus microplus]|uniref:thymine DNA glycosylase isoform X2 n=1 Tax=Rhipicephalus microplus TaxID=6941 RepID=UPI003F6C003F